MGNSSTKEQRPPPARSRPSDTRQPPSPAYSGLTSTLGAASTHQSTYTDTGRRADPRFGRPDFLASTGIGSVDRDVSTVEFRRETKQEREARKLEKERVAREKERERSMREEHVDGGYLVTQGVYTGIEDYNKAIVRHMMIERRLAPFWKGLNDHKDSWTENQLVAVARGLPLPAADEIPAEDDKQPDSSPELSSNPPQANVDSLMVPISSRAQSLNSETSSNQSSPFQSTFPPSLSVPPPTSSTSIGSALAKGRSKTLASLTSSSKSAQAELKPREIKLPHDPNVNCQRLEAYLYKDALECSICYLYYPPYLNRTRCCDQAICSECFVQIKRPDPHRPEHADTSALSPTPEDGGRNGHDGDLISEPAGCPFCRIPEFGITYEPPPFRRGLAYANHPSSHALNRSISGMSSTSSLASTTSNGAHASSASAARRRTMSVSVNSPTVITTDQVRPDWVEKLALVRAHTARRSAAATALHTAAYLMGNRGHEPDLRGFGALGRRGLLRRASGGESQSYNTQSSQLSMLALLSERHTASNSNPGTNGEVGPAMTPGPRESSRRGRIDDLEDMMMMEAIRLSLASEEERRKKEEEEAKKEAKKKEKETKKAEKAAKKTGFFSISANASTSALDEPSQSSRKGKAQWQRESEQLPEQTSGVLLAATTNPQTHLERARAQILPEGSPLPSPSPSNPTTYRPSHLRTQSNISSSASSIDGSPPGSLLQDPREPGTSMEGSPSTSAIHIPMGGLSQGSHISGTPPAGGAGTEPMFNFRSLAAMVGDDELDQEVKHTEIIDGYHSSGRQRGESSMDAACQENDDIQVKNIAHQTSEKEVRDFFSFCGKITSLSVTPASEAEDSPKSATVTFEKETAAKTALLLDNTQLGPSQVHVSSAAGISDLASSAGAATQDDTNRDEHEIAQEDKPRSRIVAEYLAHGYAISDAALQRAIALDNKHGVSNRFTSALQNFDSRYKASDRAKGIDQSYGITQKAGKGWAGISSYFEKAMGTPTGQKLAAFYTQTDKQVRDIHAEAKRLVDLKKGGAGEGTGGGTMAENEKTMEKVPGTEKTTCQCGGDTGVCPCEEGKCACSGCAKSGVQGEKTATGPADTVAATSEVQPLGEKSV
ncbi:MAG: hypothetical protein Q9217_002347 [Psora testacea]